MCIKVSVIKSLAKTFIFKISMFAVSLNAPSPPESPAEIKVSIQYFPKEIDPDLGFIVIKRQSDGTAY